MTLRILEYNVVTKIRVNHNFTGMHVVSSNDRKFCHKMKKKKKN